MTKLFRDLDGGPLCPRGSVVCIGAFDGLHIGHRALVRHAVARARSLGVAAAVLSFEPLPREFLAPAAPAARLTLPRAKLRALSSMGADVIGLLRFNQRLAAMSPEDFALDILGKRLGAREVWVGDGFGFGHRRGGNIETLRNVGATAGFTAHAFQPVSVDGERVSSTRVRAALADGDFGLASRLLGRPYSIAGRVVRGQQLGRALGFPTANLRLGGRLPALGGILAVRVHGIAAEPMPGVASIGTRPTVGGREPLLEVHLFDFDGDLYGRRIEVECVAHLRDEQTFPDLASLVAQMHRDAARARAILDDLPRQAHA